MPKADDGGWRGRIRKGIDSLLVELESLQEDDAKRMMTDILSASKHDIGRKTVEGLYADLFEGGRGKRGTDRIRKEDTFEVFSEKRHSEAFIELVNLRVRGDVKGETDEPVTSDIRRLIRLPSSLHGKTGFVVVPLSRERLDSFDPFDDAVPGAFDDSPVNVRCDREMSLKLRGQRLSLSEGENEVPAYFAVHLICRNLASVDNGHKKY